MLILSRKQNQEIIFPNLGVRIEVARIRGNTVCLGIDAPKEISVLRGELENHQTCYSFEDGPKKNSNHELRNRLNAMSLCLHIMREKQEAQQPIEGKILNRAIQELHTIEEICGCESKPNPFMDRLFAGTPSPFVLLVDDATNEAELLAAYLRHVGIKVALSSDGDAALNLLNCIDRKPGIILLDMLMPGRNGYSTLQALRENSAYDAIKVFAVTGLPEDESAQVDGCSVDRWFQKPIKPDQLAAQIQLELAIPA